MIAFHVRPRGDRWQVSHNGSCIGIHDSRDETLQHACALAQSTGDPLPTLRTHAQIVLYDADGHERRHMTVPRSGILL